MPRFEVPTDLKRLSKERKLPPLTGVRGVWERVKDAFQGTFWGGWVTAQWRETIHWLWYNSFTRGVYTRSMTRDSAEKVGRAFHVPFRDRRRSTWFIPMGEGLAPGQADDPDSIIGKMEAEIAGLPANSPKSLELKHFIDTYREHRRKYDEFRRIQQLAERRGRGGTADYGGMTAEQVREQLATENPGFNESPTDLTLSSLSPGERLALIHHRLDLAHLEINATNVAAGMALLVTANPKYAALTALEKEAIFRRRMEEVGELKLPTLPELPSPNSKQYIKYRKGETSDPRNTSNMVKFGGKWYVLATGLGTTATLFEQVGYASGPRGWWARAKGAFRTVRDWREWNRADSHVYPPETMKDFHFNLLENRWKRGQSQQENFDLTLANLQKMMTDPANQSFNYKMLSEVLVKRWRHHKVTHITGRFLAQAMSRYSSEPVEGLVPPEHVPGYESDKRISMNTLGVDEILAVTRVMVESGLPGSMFKTKGMHGLEPYEIGEMNDREAELAKEPPTQSQEDELKLIRQSKEEGVNWWVISREASSRVARDMKGKIKPWCEFLVNADGTLDTVKVEFTKEGKSRVFMPLGASPYEVHRWNIPTISANALRVFNYFWRFRPYLEKMTAKGKAQDTSGYQFLLEERQGIKQDLARSLHEGSADSAEEMAIKLAAGLNLDPERTAEYYLVLHELMERWDGTKFDHLRRQINKLLINLDDEIKSFYFGSGVDTEKQMSERRHAYERRGNFLFRLSSDISLMRKARLVHKLENQAIAKAEEGDAEGVKKFEELAKATKTDLEDKIFKQYGSEIAVTTHTIERADRRIQNVAGWLVNHNEALTTFFITPHEVAQVGGGEALADAKWYAPPEGVKQKSVG